MNLNLILRTNRPELSDSSIKTYSSILFNLYTSVFGITPLKMDNFNNVDEIQNYLDEAKEPNVRKTILSALYVLTKNPKYRDQMLDNIKAYNVEINKQEKSPAQKESWLKTEEINQSIISAKSRAINAYRNIRQLHAEHGNKDIGNVFSKQFQIIQDYIILCLLSGSFIPPRRSKDYVDFKIKNIDTTIDNYIKGSKMYFNSYKGSGTKGLQVIEIPIALKNILTKWIKNNPTEYLLFDSAYNQMSNVKLTQRLNKIFSRKASINSLRKSYLTDKHLKTVENMDELKKDMKMMGSSILQAISFTFLLGSLKVSSLITLQTLERLLSLYMLSEDAHNISFKFCLHVELLTWSLLAPLTGGLMTSLSNIVSLYSTAFTSDLSASFPTLSISAAVYLLAGIRLLRSPLSVPLTR